MLIVTSTRFFKVNSSSSSLPFLNPSRFYSLMSPGLSQRRSGRVTWTNWKISSWLKGLLVTVVRKFHQQSVTSRVRARVCCLNVLWKVMRLRNAPNPARSFCNKNEWKDFSQLGHLRVLGVFIHLALNKSLNFQFISQRSSDTPSERSLRCHSWQTTASSIELLTTAVTFTSCFFLCIHIIFKCFRFWFVTVRSRVVKVWMFYEKRDRMFKK